MKGNLRMRATATGFRNDNGIGALFDDVYLLDGRRTPFGKFCGALSTVSPTDLGIKAARAAIDPSRFVWVVVGDAAVVQPQLEALGLPVEVRAAN